MREIIEKYVTIWNSNGISSLEVIFSKQSKYWDATQHGNAIELLKESIATTHTAFSNITFQIIALNSTEENKFFLEWKMTGVNSGEFFGYQPTGKKIAIEGLDSIDIKSNKITEIRSFYDSSLFNQQLGLQ